MSGQKTKPAPSAARKAAAAARYAEGDPPDKDAAPFYDANDLLGVGATDAETIGRIARGLGGAIRMEEA